jgi:hypothetical protein
MRDRVDGRSYSKIGSPQVWAADDDGREALPEVAARLDARDAPKTMKNLGWKRAGRRRQGETADDRRLVMYESGMRLEQIAEQTGLFDLESVRRSINRGRARRRKRRTGQ